MGYIHIHINNDVDDDGMDDRFQLTYLETECRLFPPVTKFLDLFLCAGYFFNALY